MTARDLKEAVENNLGLVAPPFDSLIERIGYEPLYGLAEEFGGCPLYIPTVRNMFKKCLISAVIAEFDGANHRALAKKYGFSVNGVREFVKNTVVI